MSQNQGALVGRMTIGEREGGASPTLADRIKEWADEFVGPEVDDAVLPYQEALEQLARGVHAVGEFIVEPMKASIETVIEKQALDAFRRPAGSYPIPEGEREVSFADVGRLVAHVDEMRQEIYYLLEDVHEMGLRVRDELPQLAAGFALEPDMHTRMGKAWWQRFYGLTADSLEPRLERS